ncbi:response regulator [Catenovulum sp. SX2]|uniref:response regulator n=1 Tax=Catenovulum sp. SX2 TaxID=3398614 RepID=UPI003F87A12D
MLSFNLSKCARILGVLSFLLGLTVLIGWYTHHQALIQVLPHFAPMQYNAALGFFIAGIALTWHNSPKIVYPLSLFVALVGGLTLIQYLFGINFGIDQLLMEHYVTTKTSHPGRMAPNTAICFCMAGFTLTTVMKKANLTTVGILSCFIFSTLVIALGVIALVGYFTALETTYGWGHYTRMAVHTSIGFIFIGASLTLLVFNKYKEQVTTKDWISAAATVGLVTIVLILWQTLVARETKNIQAAIEYNLLNLAERIDTQLSLNRQAVDRLAERMAIMERTDNQLLKVDINNYLNDHVSFVAISLVENNTISQIYARDNLDKEFEYVVAHQLKQQDFSSRAMSGRYFSLNQTSDLSPLLHYITPINSQLISVEYLVVTIEPTKQFLSSKKQQQSLGYHLDVKDQQKTVYAQSNIDNPVFIKQWKQSTNLKEIGWQIEVTPHKALISSLKTGLAEIVLLFGIVLSFAIVAAIRMWQIAIERAKSLELQKTLLSQSVSKLELAAKIVKLGVWEWNLKENTQVWDQQLRRIYGVAEQSTLDKDMYQVWQKALHPEDAEQAITGLKSAIKSNAHSWQSEFRLKLSDGTIKYISANGVIERDNSGKAVNVIGTNLDVTAQKEMEHRLIVLKEKADAANQAKSDFLANMSHEIRTPMNGIIGLTQLVLSMPIENKVREHLQKVEDSSKALLNIINDILDYSKIEAGKLNVVEEDFDLERLLSSTAGILSVRAEDKNNELNFEIEPGISQFYRGDALRLNQILNNLVGNAIKFTDNGLVSVQVTQKHYQDSVWLTFAVKDTGIGMTQEQTARLFQPFSQADQSITRRFGGTGLGLTISKRLIDLMGGEIGVSSEPNHGSTFTFSIPVKRANKKQNTKRGLSKQLKTLVVDDNLETLAIIEGILNSWKFKVELTASPLEALDKIIDAAENKDPYELLIIDWKMPEMDGIELTSNIRKRVEEITSRHQCIVIMVTAHGKDHVVQHAQNVAIDAVIEKPIFASHLHDVLVDLQNELTELVPDTESTKGIWDSIPQFSDKHILLVEDNEINQLVAVELLNKFGITSSIANNGREGVELFEQQSEKFDLILMDLQMPEMDGFEATSHIRKINNGKDIPIIAMTAAAMPKDVEEAIQSGMDAHISKPIDVKIFTQTLNRFLQKQAV